MFDVDVRWLPRASAATPARRRPGPARGGDGRRGSPAAFQPIEPDVVAAVRASDRIRRRRRARVPAGHRRDPTCRTAAARRRRSRADVDVYALAGALTLEEQDRALAPSPPGRRRVVLSTDIAETSLTVDGVRIVIDAGLAREPRFDVRTGLSRLTTVTTSRASADQRAGRAGRTEPGVAYRLWSKIEHGSRPRHRRPEILQADLAGFALELAAWGTDAGDLAFIDAPPASWRSNRRGRCSSTCTRSTRNAIDPDAIDGRAARSPSSAGRCWGSPSTPDWPGWWPSSGRCWPASSPRVVDERDMLRGRPDDLPADLSSARRRGRRARRATTPPIVAPCSGCATGRPTSPAAPASTVRSRLDRRRPYRRHAAAGLPRPGRRPSPAGQFQLRSGGAAWLPDDDSARPRRRSSSPPTSTDGATGRGSVSPPRSTPPM